MSIQTSDSALKSAQVTGFQLKSTSFTAMAGGLYAVDTSSGVVTALLPAAPSLGDVVEFADAASTWNTNPCTIGHNGNQIGGIPYDYIDSSIGDNCKFIFVGGSIGWQYFSPIVKPRNLTAPTITGLAVEGSTLTDADTDTWSGSPTSFTRQWQSTPDGGTTVVNISGATGSTYTIPSSGVVGWQYRLIKVAINSNGNSLPAPSAWTSAVVVSLLVNLTAYWSMGDSSFADLSGNGNDLTNSGVTVGTGLLTGCAVFDGSGQILTNAASNCLNFGTGDFTISGWVNLVSYGDSPTGTTGETFMDIRTPSFTNGGFYNLNTSGQVIFNGTAGDTYSGTNIVPLSSWVHLIFQRTSGNYSVYINGTLDGSPQSAGGQNFEPGQVYFGKNQDGLVPLNASLCEWGVWNRALTSTEISALYNGGSGLPYSSFGTV